MRALLGTAAASAVVMFLGCEQLDPVKTESLCEHRNPVSMRCPQCQTQPYEPECSVCSGIAKNDPGMCKPKTTTDMNPSTTPDDGKTADGARADGSVGEGGAGAEPGSVSAAGAGAAGSGTGPNGTGGMSGSGGAGGAPSLVCTDNLWCSSRTPAEPACDFANRRCVQCVQDKDCSGSLHVCNVSLHRCANCLTDADCPGRRCDAANMVCVDCELDTDCTTDPVKNNCDTRTHSCVDCVTGSGCADQTVNKTCDPDMFACVDCLQDGDCEPSKPACDKPNRTCVACTANFHCTSAPNQTCDVDKQICVDCLDDSGCAGATPRCNVDAQKCVACLDGSDCASGHCVDQACVECEDDGDCGDADASHCDPSSHKCVGCTSTAQCEHLSATRACDTTNRRCVECNDDSTCSGKACLRAKHECSDVNVNSVDVCRACQADSMCMTNMKCISMSYNGSSYGTYCAFTQSSRSQGRCASARPYSQGATVRSVDGNNQTYCVPPSSTTCPGVLDLQIPRGGKSCTGAAVCGRGVGDGTCNVDMRCTYGCTDDVDCTSDTTCLSNLTCGT
jgi:hypothetical protein